MHKYLRAIGFSKFKSRKEVEDLLLWAEENSDQSNIVQKDAEESCRQTYTKVGKNIGISSFGILDIDEKYYRDFYFPYLTSDLISTEVDCDIQRHAEKES